MRILGVIALVLMSFFTNGQSEVDTLYKKFSSEEVGLLCRAEFPIQVLQDGNPFVLNHDTKVPYGVRVKVVPDSIPAGSSGKLVVYINRRLDLDNEIYIELEEKYNKPANRVIKLVFEKEEEKVLIKEGVESVVIKGKVFNAKTKSTLVGRVNILNLGSNEKVSFNTNSNGEFHTAPLSASADYVLQIGAKHCKVQLDTIKGAELTELIFSKNYYLERFEEGAVVPLDNVLFKVGTAEILPASFSALDGLVMMMKLNPNMKIRIDGHTDNSASKSSSIKLSTQRAEAVKFYLIRHKVLPKQVATKGSGAAHPVVPNTSETNREKNRRVEFVVVKL